ncbi:MAG TPA: hypothetical protein VEZ40_02735 [Pyrinomonadaceae bacterium]|nr:hypothetical protein [Pyrinomonadaceae bacterium]
MQRSTSRTLKIVPGLIGLAVGGVVGFLLRPSAFLVGQLPLGVVVTRGEYLSGIDRLYKQTAELSFNYVLVGAITGVVLGVVLGYFIPKERS